MVFVWYSMFSSRALILNFIWNYIFYLSTSLKYLFISFSPSCYGVWQVVSSETGSFFTLAVVVVGSFFFLSCWSIYFNRKIIYCHIVQTVYNGWMDKRKKKPIIKSLVLLVTLHQMLFRFNSINDVFDVLFFLLLLLW